MLSSVIFFSPRHVEGRNDQWDGSSEKWLFIQSPIQLGVSGYLLSWRNTPWINSRIGNNNEV